MTRLFELENWSHRPVTEIGPRVPIPGVQKYLSLFRFRRRLAASYLCYYLRSPLPRNVLRHPNARAEAKGKLPVTHFSPNGSLAPDEVDSRKSKGYHSTRRDNTPLQPQQSACLTTHTTPPPDATGNVPPYQQSAKSPGSKLAAIAGLHHLRLPAEAYLDKDRPLILVIHPHVYCVRKL